MILMSDTVNPPATEAAILAETPSRRLSAVLFFLLSTRDSAYLKPSAITAPETFITAASPPRIIDASRYPAKAAGSPSRTAQINASPSGAVSKNVSAPEKSAATAA